MTFFRLVLLATCMLVSAPFLAAEEEEPKPIAPIFDQGLRVGGKWNGHKDYDPDREKHILIFHLKEKRETALTNKQRPTAPATFSFTDSDENADLYQITSSLTFDLNTKYVFANVPDGGKGDIPDITSSFLDSVVLGGYFSYNRNNADTEQHEILAGITVGTKQWALVDNYYDHDLYIQGGYVNDETSDSDGIDASLIYRPIVSFFGRSPEGFAWHNWRDTPLCRTNNFSIVYNTGPQFQILSRSLSTERDPTDELYKDGEAAWLIIDYSLRVFPLWKPWQKTHGQIELRGDWRGIKRFSEGGTFEEEEDTWDWLIKGSLVWHITGYYEDGGLKTSSPSIELTYTDGSDPTAGIERETKTTLKISWGF